MRFAKFTALMVGFGALTLLAGCGNKADNTVNAAPPPPANARPETMGGQPKNMPGQATPTPMSAPARKPAGM